jgi:sn-glycerol 3-phosphate transport system substrate-binding protein
MGALTQNAKDAGFELGTAFWPANAKVERVGVIIGGASLWIGAGHPEAENKAAVKFILWLLAPEQMAQWHKGTGYMPITKSAQKLLEDEGYFVKNPGQKTAVDQLNAAKSTSATAGAIMGTFPQIRTIVDQALQAVTTGTSVDEALKEAKTKADESLKEYNSRLATPAK